MDHGVEQLRKPEGTPRLKLLEAEAFGQRLGELSQRNAVLLNETIKALL